MVGLEYSPARKGAAHSLEAGTSIRAVSTGLPVASVSHRMLRQYCDSGRIIHDVSIGFRVGPHAMSEFRHMSVL
eukprot:836579-Rhodomonas_salina.5